VGTRADRDAVEWRPGVSQVFSNLATNKVYLLKEGPSIPIAL
jgi:hypothetical protein